MCIVEFVIIVWSLPFLSKKISSYWVKSSRQINHIIIFFRFIIFPSVRQWTILDYSYYSSYKTNFLILSAGQEMLFPLYTCSTLPMYPFLVISVGENYTTKAKNASFQVSSHLRGQEISSGYMPEESGYEWTAHIGKWMGCRIKVAFSWSELYWSGRRVASVVALSCLTGHLWAVLKGSFIMQRHRLSPGYTLQ